MFMFKNAALRIAVIKLENSVVITVCNHYYCCCWLCLSFDLTLFLFVVIVFLILAILQLCVQCSGLFYSCVFSALAYFIVVCSVPWPLNRSEAGGDLVLLQIFLLFMCKSWYFHANKQVNMIINIWKTRRFVTKQGHRQQRQGHWAHNYKMVYCQREVILRDKRGNRGNTVYYW